MNVEGAVSRQGFYTTRFVESTDEEHAELAAVELIRNDETLQKSVLNERADAPLLFVEEINEIPKSMLDEQGPLAGYTFYEQKPETD